MIRVRLCRGDERARKVCSPCQKRLYQWTRTLYSLSSTHLQYSLYNTALMIACMDCKLALKHIESSSYFVYRKRKLGVHFCESLDSCEHPIKIKLLGQFAQKVLIDVSVSADGCT